MLPAAQKLGVRATSASDRGYVPADTYRGYPELLQLHLGGQHDERALPPFCARAERLLARAIKARALPRSPIILHFIRRGPPLCSSAI